MRWHAGDRRSFERDACYVVTPQAQRMAEIIKANCEVAESCA
jgi:hypothetical protein